MNWGRIMTWAVGLGLAGSGALLVNSCSTTSISGLSVPAVPGATFVGNKACAARRDR
jgi:hypothetical protein